MHGIIEGKYGNYPCQFCENSGCSSNHCALYDNAEICDTLQNFMPMYKFLCSMVGDDKAVLRAFGLQKEYRDFKDAQVKLDAKISDITYVWNANCDNSGENSGD